MNGCVSLFRAGDVPRLHREVPHLLFDDRSHVNDAGERFSAQAFQHDPDLVFSRKMPPCCPANILYDTFGRGLGLARVIWSHLMGWTPPATRPHMKSC